MAKSKQSGADFIDALPEDGERRLMLAVLIDAIRNVSQSARDKANEHYAWARDRAWLQRDDHKTPFSFLNICSALGLNAGYVRRWIKKLEEADAALKLHRYAAKVEESWERQRRPAGAIRPPRRRKPSRRLRHSAFTAANHSKSAGAAAG
ncbi:MAG TPA: hypothetical protein VEB21_18920 [Terriglobales bacterium]|nr:hypothetical protein [Terriglobales bacterium]